MAYRENRKPLVGFCCHRRCTGKFWDWMLVFGRGHSKKRVGTSFVTGRWCFGWEILSKIIGIAQLESTLHSDSSSSWSHQKTKSKNRSPYHFFGTSRPAKLLVYSKNSWTYSEPLQLNPDWKDEKAKKDKNWASKGPTLWQAPKSRCL